MMTAPPPTLVRALPSVVPKRCAKCGDLKAPDYFYKSSRHADGRQSYCIACDRSIKKKKTVKYKRAQRGNGHGQVRTYTTYANMISEAEWRGAGRWLKREVVWHAQPWKRWPNGTVRGVVVGGRPRFAGSPDTQYFVHFSEMFELGRYLWIAAGELYDAKDVAKFQDVSRPAICGPFRSKVEGLVFPRGFSRQDILDSAEDILKMVWPTSRRPDYNLWLPLS